MIWDDKGFLISKFKYNENSVIADFFTLNHGRCSGIIFGATSNKIRGYLQIGNLFQLNFNSKNENKIGSFKVEIIDPITPFFFNNRKKLHCITAAMSMIKLLTAENQKNYKIFELINEIFTLLKNDNWIKNYILWELNLLKLVGYDLELKKIVNKESKNDKIEYFVENSNTKKFVPAFLVESNIKNIEINELLNGLKLVTNYLEKNVLIPNNINQPIQRTDFINLLKL
ncbi:MAG: DNA repair protein RecO [Candidatus Pelagibacter sp.]